MSKTWSWILLIGFTLVGYYVGTKGGVKNVFNTIKEKMSNGKAETK